MLQRHYKALGIMSGTSLDGVDIALISFNPNLNFEIIAAKTYSYSKTWYNRLCFNPDLNAQDFALLDVEYGRLLGELCNSFIKDFNLNKAHVDLIASHGHTWFHQPEKKLSHQLGCGPEIFVATGIKTITDFRKQDLAYGGQGAPLVPIGDRDLFAAFDACINIGGFANVSFKKNEKLEAFDICPANIILNRLARSFNKEYDHNGDIAKSGAVDYKLLNHFLQIDYFKNDSNKSLGVEWLETQFWPIISQSQIQKQDVLATCCQFIGLQIAKTLNAEKISSSLFTGGGVYNSHLINIIKRNYHGKLHIPNNQLVNYKETLIFAYLGVLKQEDKINVLSSTTGAYKDHSSGVIYN